jgi:hypothetical protein
LLTVHDSFLCGTDYVDEVEAAIMAEFAKYHVKPKLERKPVARLAMSA